MRFTRVLRSFLGDERGQALAFIAVALVPMLAMSGLAIDLGRGFVTRSHLSRAIDAACLAAARAIRQGETLAEQEAWAVAAANGVRSGVDGVTLTLDFGTTEDGEYTVAMTARKSVPTLLMKVLGYNTLDVATAAEATVPPLDIVLVLDRSGSLGQQSAWRPLQDAASDFVLRFSDDIDQMGLVSFQIRAEKEIQMDFGFKTSVTSAITRLNSVGDTNTGEGLSLAFQQLQSATVREAAEKVVVFFTDGRPTAFRASIGGQDRIMAVPTGQSSRVRGLFDNPGTLPMNHLANPDDCHNALSCYGYDVDSARNQARQNGIASADQIRAQGIHIFTIALGNPHAHDPLHTPDLDYLELIANVDGRADPAQPKGRSYFAPTASDLDDVFNQLASELLVRLSR